MTAFAVGALVLIALALALLRPVWRMTPVAAPAAPELAQLARVAGAHGPSPVAATAAQAGIRPARPRNTLIAVGLAVPIFAIALYAAIGNPGAATLQSAGTAVTVKPGPGSAAEAAPEALQAMLATMADRLEKSPGNAATDLEGWSLVARSYAALQRFGDADRAYARVLALAPDDAQLLADRADVLMMLQGGRSTGEPERLIDRALAIAPTHPKVLALAGAAALERNDLAAARRHWQQARDLAPPGSEFAADLDRSLAGLGGTAGAAGAGTANSETRGATNAAAAPTPMPALANALDQTPAPQPPARISGRASLSPALAARAAPGDTVFIFARAAEGPRMPLAILRTTVAELPRDFTLDDSLAMSPQLKLSAFPRVVVGVRVSRSGSATPQPGDLRGESAPTGNQIADLRIVVDQVQP